MLISFIKKLQHHCRWWLDEPGLFFSFPWASSAQKALARMISGCIVLASGTLALASWRCRACLVALILRASFSYAYIWLVNMNAHPVWWLIYKNMLPQTLFPQKFKSCLLYDMPPNPPSSPILQIKIYSELSIFHSHIFFNTCMPLTSPMSEISGFICECAVWPLFDLYHCPYMLGIML